MRSAGAEVSRRKSCDTCRAGHDELVTGSWSFFGSRVSENDVSSASHAQRGSRRISTPRETCHDRRHTDRFRQRRRDWCAHTTVGAAARDHDRNGILADRDSNIVMFDVPPPLQSKALEAYEKTWNLFFGWRRPADACDVRELEITGGNDVAFAVAHAL
jgi:ketosteroid isomerase-like protein